jgi:hypothetical protein
VEGEGFEAEGAHVEDGCVDGVELALRVGVVVDGYRAWPFGGLVGGARNALLAEAVFAAEVLHAGLFGRTIVANFAGLLLSGFGADAVFADEVRAAAVGCVAQIAGAAEGAVALFGDEGV